MVQVEPSIVRDNVGQKRDERLKDARDQVLNEETERVEEDLKQLRSDISQLHRV